MKDVLQVDGCEPIKKIDWKDPSVTQDFKYSKQRKTFD